MLAWLKEHKYQDLLAQGCWIAVHNGTLNHPLDYPADAVNQKGTPVTQQEFAKYQWAGDINYVNGERMRGKNPGQTLLSVNAEGKDTGGSNCWLKFQAYRDLFVQAFGFEIPVLGTEGGVWCDTLADPRYPKISVEMQRDWTLEICRKMMANEYPDYYFCTGFWLIANRGMGAPTANGFENDAWYSPWRGDTDGRLPVVDALKALPKQVRRGAGRHAAAAASPPAPAASTAPWWTRTRRRPPAPPWCSAPTSPRRGPPRPVATGKFRIQGAAGRQLHRGLGRRQPVGQGRRQERLPGRPGHLGQGRLQVRAGQAGACLPREEGACACAEGCGIFGTVTDNDGKPAGRRPSARQSGTAAPPR